jgi:hypothetical protein
MFDEDDDDFDEENEGGDEDINYDEEFIRDSRLDFADPGGRSALRAETPDNPRDCDCPTCGDREVLTRLDIQLGYQCDRCADAAESGV